MPEPQRVQLHLTLPYNIEVRRNKTVQGYFRRGFLIEQLQRVTDREVLVTLVKTEANEAS